MSRFILLIAIVSACRPEWAVPAELVCNAACITQGRTPNKNTQPPEPKLPLEEEEELDTGCSTQHTGI